MRRISLIGTCLIALTLVACQIPPKYPTNYPEPIVNPQISVPTVTLQVTGGQLEVVGDETPSCGSDDAARGCILTGLANISVARVELGDSGGYALTRFWVCDGTNKPAEGAADCVLSSVGQEEFLVVAGRADDDRTFDNPSGEGLVELGGVDDFLVVNQNSIRADYFYLVEACNGGTHCAILDPRIRNGGRTVTP